MIVDESRNFICNLYQYLVGTDSVQGLLIKKHNGNLRTQGDFSFPNSVKSWQEVLNEKTLQNDDSSLLKCIGKDIAHLLQTSQDWEIPVAKAIELNERVHVFVDRCKAIRVSLQNSNKNHDIILQKLTNDTSAVVLDAHCTDTNCITYLRLNCLKKAVKNLCLLSPNSDVTNILVTWKSSSNCHNDKTVFCGTVLNAKTGSKENAISAEEYIRIRQDELTLIAQHKYGVRVSTEEKWKDFIAHLGESAVTFELLQTKSSSPVKIQFDASGGSSKGAAFILYNCARLETMIKTFNEKVNEGSYPPLPSLDTTELSLLTDEDEWCLIFNYIMGLPSLLMSSVELSDKKCEFRPHLICNFLSSMVKVFSQYYRRVRILTEPRKHLLPVMFARLHMLIILNKTLKICLRILNIKSVSQMYLEFHF